MFEVEKPRKFHYEPRFYDPEKEKWEALKKKYAIEQERKEKLQNSEETNGESNGEKDDLAYFEERLRTLDRQKRQQSSRLSWKDLFRKGRCPRSTTSLVFRDKEPCANLNRRTLPPRDKGKPQTTN